jgi:hypothetical protein
MRNAATDFGPLLSLLLNSLLLRSLKGSTRFKVAKAIIPQNLISELRVIVLLGENLEQFSHGFREMLIVLQVLYDCRLCTKAVLLMLDCEGEDFEYSHFDCVVL